MTTIPLARVFNVCLRSRSFPLRLDWLKSDSSVDGEPQGNFRWNSNFRDVVASSPSFSRPATRAPRRACSQANSDTFSEIHQNASLNSLLLLNCNISSLIPATGTTVKTFINCGQCVAKCILGVNQRFIIIFLSDSQMKRRFSANRSCRSFAIGIPFKPA